MSTERVSQFLLAVSADSVLKQKLAAVTDSVNFVKIAEDSGYSFTLEDLQTYIAEHNNGELSEDELEAVAGGKRSYALYQTVRACAIGGCGGIAPPGKPGGGGGVGGSIED